MHTESEQYGPERRSLIEILTEAGKPLYLSEAVQIAGEFSDEVIAAAAKIPRLTTELRDEMWLAIGRNEMELTPDRKIKLLGEQTSKPSSD